MGICIGDSDPDPPLACEIRRGRGTCSSHSLVRLLIVSALAIYPTAAQVSKPFESSWSWAEQQLQRSQEQCLCSIPEYALFHSRTYGRSACGRSPLLHGARTPEGSRQPTPHPTTTPHRPAAGTSGTLDPPAPHLPEEASEEPAAAADAYEAVPDASASTQAQDPSAAPQQPSPSNTDPDPDQRLIVRFKHYAPEEAHRAALASALGPEGPDAWTWLQRTNPAAAHPTDFGLLAAPPGATAAEALTARLQALGPGLGLRGVHADRRYTGKLAWVPEGPLADLVLDMGRVGSGGGGQREAGEAAAAGGVGGRSLLSDAAEGPGGSGGADGADEPGPDEAVFAVSRRPGRLVTRFSAEDLEGDPEADMQVTGPADVGANGGATHGSGSAAALDELDLDGPARARLVSLGRSGQRGGEQQQQQQQQEGNEEEEAGSAAGQGLAGDAKAAQRRRMAAVEEEEEEAVGAARGLGRGRRMGAPREPGEEEGEGLGPGLRGGGGGGGGRRGGRQLLGHRGGTVPVMLEADKLWKQGYTGKGVKVGIFDTGIRADHPHIRNTRERTNWTHQDSLSDGLGHGSFVAGVVGGQDTQCPGFAPDVELYTFKVFTDDQVSYTSWFLDAFNYAITVKVHVINLSIGGPDFLDQPFVEKVLEVTSNGILLISAIGNDGPLYGTLNNPADQNDVIGVGGIDNWDAIAGFSSRGMSTWELPRGYGRVKPDVMAYAKDVQGSRMQTGCRSLSGTSVASPVVAGAVALLASTVPAERRWDVLNPASMKQALVEGAVRLGGLHLYEQGAGRINLPNSMAILQAYTPRASIIPAALDLTDCPYMWPFCRTHLYAGALPVMVNATLLNGQGVVGQLEGPPVWKPEDAGGRLLHVAFEWSPVLWPWSGHLALYIRVRPEGAAFDGPAAGTVELTVVSPPGPGEAAPRRCVVRLPVMARIAPPPPRSKRLLWDQFHSLKYPPAYLPRDNLDVKSDILDWHGDHPHTNFHGLFNFLRDRGYFLEILGSPATCFDPSQYGALLIVDPEEEWYAAEVAALEAGVREQGLVLLVFADWYNAASMEQMRFFDDNTRSWWTPATGGAHVPALNELLEPFGLGLGEGVLHGSVALAGSRFPISYGADVAKVPAGGWMHTAPLNNAARKGGPVAQHGYLAGVAHGSAGGAVAVFSDSNCLDRSHMQSDCYALVERLLQRLVERGPGAGGQQAEAGQPADKEGVFGEASKLAAPYVAPNYTAPLRRPPSVFNFSEVSYVLSHPLECFPNAACERQPDTPACRDFLGRAAPLAQGGGGDAAAAAAAPASTWVLGADSLGATGGGARQHLGDGEGPAAAAAAAKLNASAGGGSADKGGGAGEQGRADGGVGRSQGGAGPVAAQHGTGSTHPYLVKHPDGSAPPAAALRLGVGGMPLLLSAACLLGLALLCGVWRVRAAQAAAAQVAAATQAAGPLAPGWQRGGGGGGGPGGGAVGSAVQGQRGGSGRLWSQPLRQRGNEV